MTGLEELFIAIGAFVLHALWAATVALVTLLRFVFSKSFREKERRKWAESGGWKSSSAIGSVIGIVILVAAIAVPFIIRDKQPPSPNRPKIESLEPETNGFWKITLDFGSRESSTNAKRSFRFKFRSSKEDEASR